MSARTTARLIALLVLSVSVPVHAQPDRPIYLDRHGAPLAVQEEGAILELLRTAREIDSEPLSSGITKAFRLTLERDGITVRAIFHHINRHEFKRKRLPNDKMVANLRDSYTSQVAAYRLSRLLGMVNIPPTILRRSQGQEGSVQLWIEDSMQESERIERGIDPPDFNIWNQRYADMRVFDNLINNIDRNTGNMLIDANGALWLIDHTRSFGKDKGLPRPETVTRCSRRLYDAVRGLDEEEVLRVMRPPDRPKREALLTTDEIAALFVRRDKLVALAEERIRDQGEALVLFDYGDPDPSITIEEADE